MISLQGFCTCHLTHAWQHSLQNINMLSVDSHVIITTDVIALWKISLLASLLLADQIDHDLNIDLFCWN